MSTFETNLETYFFFRNSYAHTTYIKNMTSLMGIFKDAGDRESLLKLIIDRLVQLDAHLPKLLDEEEEDEDEEEEVMREKGIFEMDSSLSKASDASVARKNLDAAMNVMFEYVKSCPSQRRLYNEMLAPFESHVLPAYATGHVQFLMFKLLALDAERSKGTLTGEWLTTLKY